MYSNHLLLSSEIFREHMLHYLLLCSDMVIIQNICWELHFIPKNAKESIQCYENYRGIALCSALSKVFDNSLCAKFRGIVQHINVASELFYFYCCSFYGCQLWDILGIILRICMLPDIKQPDAYSIYHTLTTDTGYLSLPDHHTYESILQTDLTISLMHWCLVTKRLMEHCFCHYWIFDVQIGLSLSFRKMQLNVWFMMFVSIDLDILWWCIF